MTFDEIKAALAVVTAPEADLDTAIHDWLGRSGAPLGYTDREHAGIVFAGISNQYLTVLGEDYTTHEGPDWTEAQGPDGSPRGVVHIHERQHEDRLVQADAATPHAAVLLALLLAVERVRGSAQ